MVETLYFAEPSEKAKAASEAPLLMLIPTYLVIGLHAAVWCLDNLLGRNCFAGCIRLAGSHTMMSPEELIWIALALPLVALALIFMFGKQPNVREACTLVVASVLFLFNCKLASHVFSGDRPVWSVGEMLPGFAIEFRVEPLGMLFALVASGLWILTTIYAIGYMRGHHEQHQTRFYGCFAIAIFAALAAAYSANLFTLFVAYELMTISTYPLVTHHGTDRSPQRRTRLPWHPAFNVSRFFDAGDRLDVAGCRHPGLSTRRNSLGRLRRRQYHRLATWVCCWGYSHLALARPH